MQLNKSLEIKSSFFTVIVKEKKKRQSQKIFDDKVGEEAATGNDMSV